MVDLLKRRHSARSAIDFFQTSSYGAGTSPGEVRIRKDVDLAIRGARRAADRGHRRHRLHPAHHPRPAALPRRPQRQALRPARQGRRAREVEVPIDYRGFKIANLFVVGYGLDVDERYRNLPYIGVLERRGSAEVPSPSSERTRDRCDSTTRTALPRPSDPTARPSRSDGWLYLSGQVGLDPATGELVAGGFEAQARQVLDNLRAVLAAAGCTFSDVVKATVYLIDFADFPRPEPALRRGHGRPLPGPHHRPGRRAPQGRPWSEIDLGGADESRCLVVLQSSSIRRSIAASRSARLTSRWVTKRTCLGVHRHRQDAGRFEPARGRPRRSRRRAPRQAEDHDVGLHRGGIELDSRQPDERVGQPRRRSRDPPRGGPAPCAARSGRRRRGCPPGACRRRASCAPAGPCWMKSRRPQQQRADRRAQALREAEHHRIEAGASDGGGRRPAPRRR